MRSARFFFSAHVALLTMTDHSRIVKKQFGVWSLYYQPTPFLARGAFTRAYGCLRDAFKSGARLVIGESAFEQAGNGTTDTAVEKQVSSAASERSLVRKAVSSPPSYFLRFVKEVHSLGPRLFYVEVFRHCWTALESTLTIYTSNRLLETTSQYLERGGTPGAIINAMAFRLALAFFSEFVIKFM